MAAERAELRIANIPAAQRVGDLSDGELRKLTLLDAFSAGADTLLLDEPTNHLDIGGMEWLEDRIAAFPGAVLIASHDRHLLDAVATSIVEVGGEGGSVEVFAGLDYSGYAEAKEQREAEQLAAYHRQEVRERTLKRAIARAEETSRNIENRTIHFYFRKRAAKVARKAVTMRSRLERELASGDTVDRPAKRPQLMQQGFPDAGRTASTVVQAEDVTLAVGGRTLLAGASFRLSRGTVTVLIGENGSGKSTLIQAIRGEHPVASGRLYATPSASIGYLAQGEDDGLPAGARAVDVVREAGNMHAADASNFLHRFLLAHEDVSGTVGQLSVGTRRRLALACMVLRGCDLLLLDEPTNHLDIPSREAFEASLAEFTGAVLIVTHDRRLIETLADEVLEIREGRLELG